MKLVAHNTRDYNIFTLFHVFFLLYITIYRPLEFSIFTAIKFQEAIKKGEWNYLLDAIFTNGDNFCDFLFTSACQTQSVSGLLYKERICFLWKQILSLWNRPLFSKRQKRFWQGSLHWQCIDTTENAFLYLLEIFGFFIYIMKNIFHDFNKNSLTETILMVSRTCIYSKT